MHVEMIGRHTMKKQNRTPPITVHNAPKEKQAILNEYNTEHWLPVTMYVREDK